MRDNQVKINRLNEEIRKCKKCSLYKTRTNALCGEGRLNARVMLIAQAPGENEDRKGIMFIGPSGKVLDELLSISGVKRSEIYMTNLIKCMLPKYRKPKANEIKVCSVYLNKEIDIINPEFLVPLGYYATRYIFEKYGVPIPDKTDFHSVYGKLFWNEKKIYPLQHPAALLYNPNARDEMIKYYKKLKIFLKVCKWYEVCPMKMFFDRGLLERKWVELYCKGDWERCIRYQREENGEYHEDWMLPDGSVDIRLKEHLK